MGKNSTVQLGREFRNFVLSRKLWMTIFGLLVLWLTFWKQIDYLFSFAMYEPEMAGLLIPAYTGLARDFMVAVTAVIGAFLGITGLVQWRHGTESIVNQISETINEHRKEDVDIKEDRNIRYNNTKEEDYYIGDPLLDEKYEY